jgi:hypothetical protein
MNSYYLPIFLTCLSGSSCMHNQELTVASFFRTIFYIGGNYAFFYGDLPPSRLGESFNEYDTLSKLR